MLTEAFYILFFYFTGEFISYFIDGFIPGSVIGMVLLFLALRVQESKARKGETSFHGSYPKHGIILRSSRCRAYEFLRDHLRVLGCPADRFRSKYNFSHRQRSVGATKTGKGKIDHG